MQEDIVIYGPDGQEAKRIEPPPVWTWKFFVPLLVAASLTAFLAGRQKSVETTATLTFTSMQNSMVVWNGYEEQRKPTDHPPDFVIVDDDRFTFHYATRSALLSQGCTGRTILERAEIWLPADANGREIRETTLHELLHIALHEAGGPYGRPVNADQMDDGERIINPSARMLLNILRDNPKLAAWLERK